MASFVIIIAMIIMVIFMAGRRRIFAKRISKLRRRTERHRCQPFGSQVALVAILTLRRRRGMGMMGRRIGMRRRRIGMRRRRMGMMERRIGMRRRRFGIIRRTIRIIRRRIGIRRRGMGMMGRRIGITRKRIVMMGRRIGIYNGEENLGEEEENNLEN